MQVNRQGLMLILIGACTLGVSARPAEAQNQAPSRLPQMTGTAQAPIEKTPGAFIAYVITQTDKDTPMLGTTVIDTTCKITPVAIESMVAEGRTYALRGVDANGTHTWDITGTVVATGGTYVDRWRLYNDRVQGDVYLDEPLTVSQTVHVAEPQPPGGGGGC